MEKNIQELFDRIDKLIFENLTEKPVILKDSKFYQGYLKLKGEYGNS